MTSLSEHIQFHTLQFNPIHSQATPSIVPAYIFLFNHILSHPLSSHALLSILIPSHLMQSHIIQSHLIQPNPNSHLIPTKMIMRLGLISFHPMSSCTISSIQSHPIQYCLISFHPFSSCRGREGMAFHPILCWRFTFTFTFAFTLAYLLQT